MTRTGLLLSLPATFAVPPSVLVPTLFVFNPDASEWVVLCGGKQVTGGPLTLSTGQNSSLDWSYVVAMCGLAVLTSSDEPIATAWPRVVPHEEFIVTAAGDIIRC